MHKCAKKKNRDRVRYINQQGSSVFLGELAAEWQTPYPIMFKGYQHALGLNTPAS